MRRGACPSLSTPMPTGDGLLARLNPRDGALSGRQLAGVAEAAATHGNGILEITARGSLQIRGLSETSASRFADTVAALSIEARQGPEIRVGALAGSDADEVADPRLLAAAIEREIAARGLGPKLAPKLSVVVDGGGALPLTGIGADIRIEALAAQVWALSIGGALLGGADPERAVAVAVEAMTMLAGRGRTARGRDLDPAAIVALGATLAPYAARPQRHAALPVGAFVLRNGTAARGVALPFGQIAAQDLAAFSRAAGENRLFRLAPGRGLLALDLDTGEDACLRAEAERLGLVTRPDDPRLAIAACAGAPACASAHLATKAIARDLAATRPGLLRDANSVHISGCGKHCARPAAAALTLTGHADGYDLAPASGAVAVLLAQLAGRHGATPRRRRA